MATKKTKKSALDYDPLAWLDEAGAQDTVSDGGEVQPVQATVTQPVDESDQVEATATGRAATSQQAIPSFEAPENPQGDANDEGTAYGFFSQDTDDMNEQVKGGEVSDESDDADAYGFFDDSPAGLETQGAGLDESGQVIETGAELTIRSVAAFKQLIDDKLQKNIDIRISSRGLQKIDTAGMQLLHSLKESLAKTHQQIAWEHPSPIINEAAQLLGIPELTGEVTEPDQGFGFFNDEEVSSASEQTEAGYGFF
jgi:anti-anti-sigma regulatory factor